MTRQGSHRPLRLGLERLEPRALLAGDLTFADADLATPVGDAEFVLYDGETLGTLATGLDRDVATRDDAGAPVAANTPRFGQPIAYAPTPDWEADGPRVASMGISSIIATGYDRDGVTPLVIADSKSLNELRIYRGDDFEVVGVLPYANFGLTRDADADARYFPTSAIIHHGLVVIGGDRYESRDGAFVPVGMGFLHTQDYGQTLELVEDVGGGDIPPIADGAADGMSRSRTWSFLNPFPVNSAGDTNAAWFPWADYLFKNENPKGGQIGLFRATRPDADSPWVVEPNRLVYETWQPDDIGGYHSHTAAITEAGVVSHWGDVGYRSKALLHAFDLGDYLNSPVTTTTVLGGYDVTATVYNTGPQPVAAAPGPEFGTHLASGDLTREMVLGFGNIAVGETQMTVDALVDKPLRDAAGSGYLNADVLHLQWVQGLGYVSGGGAAPYWQLSPDGESWASIRPPEGFGGRLWLYGDRLLALDRDHQVWTAPTPEVSVLTPLQVAPGGVNYLGDRIEPVSETPDGVAVREVVYEQNAWRYADSGVALDRQPEPPRGGVRNAYEFVVTTNETDLGQWWLQPAGAGVAGAISSADRWFFDFRIANLSDQSVRLAANLRGDNELNDTQPLFNMQSVAATDEWVALGSNERALDGANRMAVELDLFQPAPGTRFLLAPVSLGGESSTQYPLDPLAAGPAEVASMDFDPLGEDFTAAFAFAWSEAAPRTGRDPVPVASLVGDDGDSIEVTVRYSSQFDAQWVAALRDSGEEVAQAATRADVLRGDVAEVLVGFDGRELRIDVRVGSEAVASDVDRVEGRPDIDGIDRFVWASAEETRVTAIDPLWFVGIDDRRLSDSEARAFFALEPEEKLVAHSRVPNDFNGDRSIDAADYTVWRDAQAVYQTADVNTDGLVDNTDYAVWRDAAGARILGDGALRGDLNGDGVTDAADYTLARDAVTADGGRDPIGDIEAFRAAYGRNSADPTEDFSGDGRVDAADYTVARDAIDAAYGPGTDPEAFRLAYGGRRDGAGGLVGDFTEDGSVDAADYTWWRDRATASPVIDVNRDAAIDQLDYAGWRDQYSEPLATLGDVLTPQPAVAAIEASAPATFAAGPVASIRSTAKPLPAPVEADKPASTRSTSTDAALLLLFDEPGKPEDRVKRQFSAETVEASSDESEPAGAPVESLESPLA